MRVPAVLAVAATDNVVQACRKAVLTFTLAEIVRAQVHDAATKAAKWRPFAFVIPEDTYQFDPQEFDELARDVGALVVTIYSADAPVDELAEDLREALKQAFENRRD